MEGLTRDQSSAVIDEPGNIDKDTFREIERLKELRLTHRDLDEMIHRLITDPMVDQFRIRRLKKRKLQLKDAILRLESELIPDLNA
ncbi:MAG: YdcH family protein [Pseudomonadota bacterium]